MPEEKKGMKNKRKGGRPSKKSSKEKGPFEERPKWMTQVGTSSLKGEWGMTLRGGGGRRWLNLRKRHRAKDALSLIKHKKKKAQGPEKGRKQTVHQGGHRV